MGSIIVHTLSKAFTKVVYNSAGHFMLIFLSMADPVALKFVTHNKIVFRAGTGSCLPRLKCKRNARCVVVTDSFVLINVSTMKARCSPVQFMSATEKETKNNGIIKKQNKMALYEKNGILCTFQK